MSTKYNGHKNWNHWNVSLWINNDEALYAVAKDAIRYCNNRDEAVASFIAQAPAKTPDGAPYSASSVRAAMVGL